MTFLTTELAFADAEETHTFLTKHQAANYVEPKMDDAAAAAVGRGGSGTKRKRNNIIPLEDRQWDAKVSQAALQAAKDKLRLVDVSVCNSEMSSSQSNILLFFFTSTLDQGADLKVLAIISFLSASPPQKLSHVSSSLIYFSSLFSTVYQLTSFNVKCHNNIIIVNSLALRVSQSIAIA